MAFIAHLMDPLLDPTFAPQEAAYQSAFKRMDRGDHDYIGMTGGRSNTYALDWCGDKLVTASKDNVMRLYDVENGREEHHWQGEWMYLHAKPGDPHMVAAVSWGGRFRIFDTRQPDTSGFDVDLKKTYHTMKDFLYAQWSPDSLCVAINNRQDQVYVLDIRKNLTLNSNRQMPYEVNQMIWGIASDTLWIGAGGTPGKIHIVEAPGLRKENDANVTAHQYATIALAADREGRHVATGGGDCLVTLWDPSHLVCVRTFGYPTQPVTTLSFNRDGNLLAWGTGGSGSSGGEKNLTIVGANTGSLYMQEATPTPVYNVKFHPKRNVLAYTLNASQMPDDRDSRRRTERENAVLHTLRIPDL